MSLNTGLTLVVAFPLFNNITAAYRCSVESGIFHVPSHQPSVAVPSASFSVSGYSPLSSCRVISMESIGSSYAALMRHVCVSPFLGAKGSAIILLRFGPGSPLETFISVLPSGCVMVYSGTVSLFSVVPFPATGPCNPSCSLSPPIVKRAATMPKAIRPRSQKAFSSVKLISIVHNKAGRFIVCSARIRQFVAIETRCAQAITHLSRGIPFYYQSQISNIFFIPRFAGKTGREENYHLVKVLLQVGHLRKEPQVASLLGSLEIQNKLATLGKANYIGRFFFLTNHSRHIGRELLAIDGIRRIDSANIYFSIASPYHYSVCRTVRPYLIGIGRIYARTCTLPIYPIGGAIHSEPIVRIRSRGKCTAIIRGKASSSIYTHAAVHINRGSEIKLASVGGKVRPGGVLRTHLYITGRGLHMERIAGALI